MGPRNTRERKILTHEIPTTKHFGPTNTHQKILDPQNPKRKISDPRNTHEKNFWTHEIPTKSRWHDGTKPTRPTIARDPRNLAHSIFCLFSDEKRAFSFFLWGFPCKLNTFWLGTYHTKFRFSIIR